MRRLLMALLALVGLLVAVELPQAAAHDSLGWRSGTQQMHGPEATYAYVAQNHGDSIGVPGYSLHTAARYGYVNSGLTAYHKPRRWIGAQAEAYASGTHCMRLGPYYNEQDNNYMTYSTQMNLGQYCRYGYNHVPSYITLDTVHFVYNAGWGGSPHWTYFNLNPYPTTGHQYYRGDT